MEVILWIIVIILFFWTWINHSAHRRCDEDIDEIRASLFELRTTAKSNKALMNRKLSELQVRILKNHGKIPDDRVPYTITSDCIACGTCLPECPVDAIREDEIYEIDPEKCIACKKCAEICPVHACEPLEKSD